LSAVNLGQLEEGEWWAREGIAAAREIGDVQLLRGAITVLYTALHDGGRFAEALAVEEEDLAICRDLGMLAGVIGVMVIQGSTARHQGCYDKARALEQAALSLCPEIRQRHTPARCHMELGRLALAEGAYDEARDWLQQGLVFYEAFGRHWLMGEMRSTLAYVARKLGQRTRAREHLRAALRITAENRYRNAALQSLPAMVLLLADGGEVERAVELYALVSRYPYVANSRWFEDVAGREIAAASEALPPDVLAAAQERGRARDLWAMVKELLDELAADEGQGRTEAMGC
jgi:tetratricopeptide (TPR) repeat protein